MNREIKFRAWRENKMHYNIVTSHYEHNAMSGSGGDLWDFAEWMKWSKVMQYTGLKDKNGVEIYEGDILKIYSHNQPEEVLYVADGSTAFGFFKYDSPERTDGSFESLGDYTGPDGYEIIGNIFENPELLK